MSRDSLNARPRVPGNQLGGDRNQCTGCGELFNSTAAFDKHRTGTFHPPARRCLTVTEMQAVGMTVNARGFWVTEAMDAAARARRGYPDTPKTSNPSVSPPPPVGNGIADAEGDK